MLDGGNGNDRLFGGSKNDILIVGEGHEKLKGGCGNNILINPSPSWVRQFVLDLAADGLNPNSDIRVMIADLPNEQLIGGADRRKFSV